MQDICDMGSKCEWMIDLRFLCNLCVIVIDPTTMFKCA